MRGVRIDPASLEKPGAAAGETQNRTAGALAHMRPTLPRLQTDAPQAHR